MSLSLRDNTGWRGENSIIAQPEDESHDNSCIQLTTYREQSKVFIRQLDIVLGNPMNIFYQKFQTGDIAHAVAVPIPTIQTWARRGLIVGNRESGDEVIGAGSPGHYRQFSFRNVIEIAIAKAFMDLGLGDVRALFAVGMQYAHTTRDERIPGLPYHWSLGQTLIGYSAASGQSAAVVWKHKGGTDPYWDLRVATRGAPGRAGGVAIIDFHGVYDDVCNRLNLKGAEILNLAYGKTPA